MVRPKRRKADATVNGGHCRRFGAIAARKGFVSLKEVKSAIGEQVDDDVNVREHRLHGTILYGHGFIAEYQVEVVLQELKKTLRWSCLEQPGSSFSFRPRNGPLLRLLRLLQ